MMSDGKLVTQAQQGDANAFDVLVHQHTTLVRGIIRRLIPLSDEVDDLVQETFITAFLRLDQLADADQFTSWLATIARRTCLMWQRRRYVQPALLPLDDDHQDFSPGLISAATQAARDTAACESIRSSVADALSRLPAAQRQAVHLHYLEGYDYRETATLLNVPVAAIRGRLDRARTALRKELSTMTRLFEQAMLLHARDLDALRHAGAFACCETAERPVLNSVFITGEGQLVSSDTHRLFVYASPALREMPALLLHADAARILRDRFPKATQARLQVAGEEGELQLQEGGRIPLQVLDLAFPPAWKQIVGMEFRMRVTAGRAAWSQEVDAIIRLWESGILDAPQPSATPKVVMHFVPDEGAINLSAYQQTSETATAARAFTVSFPGTYQAECGAMSIAVNPYYLREAIQALPAGADIEFSANGDVHPFAFRVAGQADTTIITMPMKLQES